MRRAQFDGLPMTSKILDGLDLIAALKAYTYIYTHSPDEFTEVITIIISNYFTQLDNNNYKFKLMKSITLPQLAAVN